MMLQVIWTFVHLGIASVSLTNCHIYPTVVNTVYQLMDYFSLQIWEIPTEVPLLQKQNIVSNDHVFNATLFLFSFIHLAYFAMYGSYFKQHIVIWHTTIVYNCRMWFIIFLSCAVSQNWRYLMDHCHSSETFTFTWQTGLSEATLGIPHIYISVCGDVDISLNII